MEIYQPVTAKRKEAMKCAQKKIEARKASKSYIIKQQFLKKKRKEAKSAVKKLHAGSSLPESLAKQRKAYKESFAEKQLRRLVEKKIQNAKRKIVFDRAVQYAQEYVALVWNEK